MYATNRWTLNTVYSCHAICAFFFFFFTQTCIKRTPSGNALHCLTARYRSLHIQATCTNCHDNENVIAPLSSYTTGVKAWFTRAMQMQTQMQVQTQENTRVSYLTQTQVQAPTQEMEKVSFSCTCICVCISQVWPGQPKRKKKKNQVPSVPCHHGSVNLKGRWRLPFQTRNRPRVRKYPVLSLW